MKVQELFPIGSVVKLRNGIRPLMIFGIKQTNLETNEEYDYIGVLYPEGNMGDKTQFLFNHEDIEEVISNHAGYEMQLYLGLPKEQPRLAWVGLILAIIADFLGNARAWFVLSVVLAVVALYCSVKGSRSSKQSVAVLGMVVSMVFLLRVVKIIIMILMF